MRLQDAVNIELTCTYITMQQFGGFKKERNVKILLDNEKKTNK